MNESLTDSFDQVLAAIETFLEEKIKSGTWSLFKTEKHIILERYERSFDSVDDSSKTTKEERLLINEYRVGSPNSPRVSLSSEYMIDGRDYKGTAPFAEFEIHGSEFSDEANLNDPYLDSETARASFGLQSREENDSDDDHAPIAQNADAATSGNSETLIADSFPEISVPPVSDPTPFLRVSLIRLNPKDVNLSPTRSFASASQRKSRSMISVRPREIRRSRILAKKSHPCRRSQRDKCVVRKNIMCLFCNAKFGSNTALTEHKTTSCLEKDLNDILDNVGTEFQNVKKHSSASTVNFFPEQMLTKSEKTQQATNDVNSRPNTESKNKTAPTEKSRLSRLSNNDTVSAIVDPEQDEFLSKLDLRPRTSKAKAEPTSYGRRRRLIQRAVEIKTEFPESSSLRARGTAPKFLSKCMLRCHVAGKTRYKCHYCSRIFSCRNSIQNHVVKFHTDKRFTQLCLHCNNFFSSVTSLKSHVSVTFN